MAKPADDADENPPKAKRAKKRKGSPVQVKARRRRARRTTTTTRSKTVVVRQNPSQSLILEDLKTVGAGLGAYGGTRLVQRLATKITQKRKPTWTKHVHAAAGAAVFAAAVLAGRRVRQLDGYHEAIVLGTGIAAVQGVVGAYVPRFQWLMSALPLPPSAASPQLTAASGDQDDDGGDYLEQEIRAMERGGAGPRRPVQQALHTAAAASGDQGLEEALVAELGDEGIDDLYQGLFADPTLFAN